MLKYRSNKQIVRIVDPVKRRYAYGAANVTLRCYAKKSIKSTRH